MRPPYKLRVNGPRARKVPMVSRGLPLCLGNPGLTCSAPSAHSFDMENQTQTRINSVLGKWWRAHVTSAALRQFFVVIVAFPGFLAAPAIAGQTAQAPIIDTFPVGNSPDGLAFDGTDIWVVNE